MPSWREARAWAARLEPLDLLLAGTSLFATAALFLYAAARQGWFSSAVMPVTAFALLGLVALFIAARVRRKLFRWDTLTLILLALLVGAAAGAHASHSFADDRDPGAYRLLAMRLVETGRFETDDPAASTWLGYRANGGSYGPEHTLGYPIVLAWGSVIWDITELPRVNQALLALSSLLVVGLALQLTGRFYVALIALALFASNFLTVWFAKDTFVENLQLPILLGMALAILRARRVPLLHLAAVPLAALILLTHISGMFFVAAYGLVAGARHFFGMHPALRSGISTAILLVPGVALALYPHLFSYGFEPSINAIKDWLNPDVTTYATIYPAIVLTAAGLIGLGHLVVIAPFSFPRGESRDLLGFFSPTFYFLLFPIISPDLPWLMRHLWPTLLPLLLLLGVLAWKPTPRSWPVLWTVAMVAVIAAQTVVTAPIWDQVEDRGTAQSYEELLEGIPARSVVLLESGLVGNYAGFLSTVHDVRAMTLTTSFPWAPRFPVDNRLNAAKLTDYVDLGNETLFVVAEGNDWTGSTFSEYFFRGEVEPIRSINLTFTRLDPTCDVQTHLSSPETAEHINVTSVMDECDRMPDAMVSKSVFVTLYRVLETQGLQFFVQNAGLRLGSGWSGLHGNASTEGPGIIVVKPGGATINALAPARVRINEHGIARLFEAGEFSYCTEGPIVTVEGPLTILSARPGGC